MAQIEHPTMIPTMTTTAIIMELNFHHPRLFGVQSPLHCTEHSKTNQGSKASSAQCIIIYV